MSYFFNEGITFLREVAKNTHHLADYFDDQIKKKEHPDCDFRLAKRHALNMLDGIRRATDMTELVHYQSQKDRRRAEDAKIEAEIPVVYNNKRMETDAEIKSWWDAAEADTPRKAGVAILDCRECGWSIRNGEEYFDSNDFRCIHGDAELSHGTATCPLCYGKKARAQTLLDRKEDPNYNEDSLYCADCGNIIHQKSHYWDGPIQWYYLGDGTREEHTPKHRVRCLACYEAYLGIGREIVKNRKLEENADRTPYRRVETWTASCTRCFKPFAEGDTYFVRNPYNDKPAAGPRRRIWSPVVAPVIGDLMYCSPCFTKEKASTEKSVRIASDHTCDHCDAPFSRGEAFYVRRRMGDPTKNSERRIWDPDVVPSTGDLITCALCFKRLIS